VRRQLRGSSHHGEAKPAYRRDSGEKRSASSGNSWWTRGGLARIGI
jgi:hypothetical protein